MVRAIVFFVSFFIVGLLSERVLAECPSEYDLPVMYYSTLYLGCYFYINGSAETAIQACHTTPIKLPEGYEETSDDPTWSLYDHAIVVRPGCIVYEYSEIGYQGTELEYLAGIHPNVLSWGKHRSFKVMCDIEHINCQPSDEFTTVLTCGALDSEMVTKCTYQETIGTSYTESITNSMSLDAGLEAEMKETFFGLFSMDLGVSVNTGYDWTHVSQSAQGVQETFQASAIVRAGYVLTIEQAVGECGGSQVNTELFRITEKNQDGESTVKYEKGRRANRSLV